MMKFLLDSASLEEVAELVAAYPIDGVTSNPSIIKAEGAIDFFPHFRSLRAEIGAARTLHIQVLARPADAIIAEAKRILENIDRDVYIKVPTTEEGLKAIRLLRREGVKVTATGIYGKTQAMLAIVAGANYIAPYFNRMANLDIDPAETIGTLRGLIDRDRYSCQIVAASFKNLAQVNTALAAGAHAVTLQPSLLRSAVNSAPIDEAVAGFEADWFATFGTRALPEGATSTGR